MKVTPHTADFKSEFQIVVEEIDLIDTTQLRAFTWSPNPKRYPSTNPVHQYKLLLTWVLLTSKKYFSYFLFIPELTDNGNVHIHGFYIIKDNIKYHKEFLPRCKNLGFIVVKHNVNTKWYEYCRKHISDTNEIMDQLPVPLTHHNIDKWKNIFSDKHLKPKRLKKMLKYIPRKTSIYDFINKK